MNTANEAALNLLQIKAIKLSPQNPFTWASGIKSPIYCDNRVSLSYPKVRDHLSNAFLELLRKYPECNVIAGVATAGIPHGAILAYRLGLPFVYVRDSNKKHGRQNKIEGELPPNAKVIMIEDLISTGGSSISAAKCLREEGHEVLAICAIFTYQLEAADQNFQEAKIPLHTITDYPTLIEVAADRQIIDPQNLELLKRWRSSPQNWQDS